MDTVKYILGLQIVQALIIAAVTAIAARLFTARGKLLYGVPHQHHYRMPNISNGDTFPVVTQQIWFQNTGRSPIQELEIILNWKPQHFEIWEPRQWDTATTPDGRFVIKLPSLNSNEFFTLSMIDTINDLPAIVNARWLGGKGRQVRMGPQRIFPMWFNVALIGVLLSGATAILYLALRISIFVYGQVIP